MKNDHLVISKNPPNYNGDEPYAFISYSHKDGVMVHEELWRLNNHGFHFWYDDGITAGDYWDQTVKEKICSDQCKVVVFFISTNSLCSESVRKEMDIVKSNNKKFFTVMLEDCTAAHTLGLLLTQNLLTIGDFQLCAHFLDEKILHVVRSSPNFFTELTKHLTSYGLSKSVTVVNVEPRVKKVLIICKGSSFSNSIINGIYDVLSSRENVILDKILIDKNLPHHKVQSAFFDAFDKNIENYDAFILRVPSKYNDQILSSIHRAQRIGKKVVLLDIEIPAEAREEFGIAQTFIGSDFASGGRLIGDKIKDIVNRISAKDSCVVLFQGPYANTSARKRCDSMDETLKDGVPDHIIHRYTLSSLHPGEAMELFREKATDWVARRTFENKTLIFFCGIDNIALEVMSVVAKNESEDPLCQALKMAKKLILIGYDGIRGVNNELILKNYGIDFLTVDVVPFKQGANAAQTVYRQLFEGQSAGNVLTQPELIEYVKYAPKKYSNAADIAHLLKGKKVFIFDLDGTLAETESLHWEAYNELLAQYDVHLTDEAIGRYIGHSEVQIYEMIKRDYGISFNDEIFLRTRIEKYLQLVKKRKLKPFDFAFDLLKTQNVCKILVTSQIPPVVERLLSHWGLEDSFAYQYCCHDGTYTKKEIYKNINRYIGDYAPVQQDEVILFEDSAHYIAQAKNYGITAIGIEHKFNQNKLHSCDAILCQMRNVGLFAGLCGLDVVYYDTQALPQENEKLRIRNFDLTIGGPAANAAITYSQMGGEAYLVSAIGDSAESRLIKEKLRRYHVNVIDIANAQSLSKCNISAIYVNTEQATRTIFSGQANVQKSRNIDFEEVAKKAKFILYDGNMPVLENKLIQYVDHYDKALVIDAGSYKPGFDVCFERATAVISSENFANPQGLDVFALQKVYGFRHAAKSCGSKPLQYMHEGQIQQISIPAVSAVDSLGAGDILHGAFCYYHYVEKLPFAAALEKAAAFASYSVEKQGVADGIAHAKAHILE